MLDDSARASTLESLASGYSAELVRELSSTPWAGAGNFSPYVASLLDIVDNVVPFIANEEEKIERETLKILSADFALSAQCHRVPVVDGHMGAVRVRLARPAEPRELREAFTSFRGIPQELALHSAPACPIIVRDEPDRPQPRLDRDAGGGMSVTVGRIMHDRVLGHRFVVLSHNTIRGAAGAALLNAELLLARGQIGAQGTRPDR